MAPKLNLGRMVGPLPLGAWIGAVGGSLAIAGTVALRRRKDGGGKGQAVIPGGAVPYPELGLPLGVPSQAGPFGLAPAPHSPSGNIPIIDNTDWQRAAIVYLTTQKGTNAYLAQQTLAKYLEGLQPLTQEEMALVEMAIRGVGPPPSPPGLAPPPLPATPPVRPAPAPAPPPVTPPPAAPGPRTVTVCPWPAWCGSLWGIAKRLTGNGNRWPELWHAYDNAARSRSKNPNLIYPGEVFKIPPNW